jgi:NAD(P)-dependent dehydrogenase (short-subunit alcohol dehydrogenase family)
MMSNNMERLDEHVAATLLRRRLIDRIADEVGPPDVLVNTIGAFHPGDALTATPETLRLMIDVNLGAALWLSQAVAPPTLLAALAHKPPCSQASAERRWNCARYLMMRPPSAHSTWPVIAAATSETR